MNSKSSNFFSSYTNIIILLLLLTTFSGAVRKWSGLPNLINNTLLLILMVIPIYLLFFYRNQSTQALINNLKKPLNIFIFILVALASNPLNLTIFHGIFGFLVHLVFIALIISYIKNKNDFDSKKIIRLFFYLLTIQLVIATAQSNSPADSFINRYADNNQIQNNEVVQVEEQEQIIALVADAVRVTGTFSYISGFTAIIFFFLLCCFYLIKSGRTKLSIILLFLVLYGSLLSGSRATVGFTLILTTIFIATERTLFVKDMKRILSIAFSIFGLLIINMISGDKLGVMEKAEISYDNFMKRFEESKVEGDGRLTGDFKEVFFRDFDYKLFGVGIGSTYQGATALFGASEIVKSTDMEGELFRTVIEAGIFFLMFKWVLLIIIFKHLDYPILLKITFFFVFCIFTPIVFNIYNAIYIASGLMLLNQSYNNKKLNSA